MYTVFYFALAIAVTAYIVRQLLHRLRIASCDSRYVFITGCDSGFGHLAAKRLDALGCHVIAGCLTEQGETELAKTCSSRLLTVHLDVTKHDSVAKAAELTRRHVPAQTGLWGIINNAGIMGPTAPVEMTTLQDYVDVFAVNCLGQIDVTKTFVPLLTPGGGRVVNVASCVGRFAHKLVSAYAVSKFGVEAFSDSLRRELKPFGVSVHIIEPGTHRTSLTNEQVLRDNVSRPRQRASPELQAKYASTLDNYESLLGYMPKVNLPAPDAVAVAMEDALLSRFPRARYVVGFDGHLLVILQRLPEWLGDAIFDFIMGPSLTKAISLFY